MNDESQLLTVEELLAGEGLSGRTDYEHIARSCAALLDRPGLDPKSYTQLLVVHGWALAALQWHSEALPRYELAFIGARDVPGGPDVDLMLAAGFGQINCLIATGDTWKVPVVLKHMQKAIADQANVIQHIQFWEYQRAITTRLSRSLSQP